MKPCWRHIGAAARSINTGIGRHGFVYLLGPEANKFVFANADAFSWRETFESLAPVDGPTALIVSDGEDHRRRRSVVAPGLRHRQIQDYVQTMVRSVRRHDRQLAARATAGHLPGLPFGGAAQHSREPVRLSNGRAFGFPRRATAAPAGPDPSPAPGDERCNGGSAPPAGAGRWPPAHASTS